MAKRRAEKRPRRQETATSFLNPSGIPHRGKTYESFYSADTEYRITHPDMSTVADYEQPTYSLSHGKGAPAAKKVPRHQHDWLIRHDYMQCRSCGVLLDIKERGSVDR